MGFDWGYGRYKVSESLSLKAGRMKYTGNLVSEYVDVGYAYPWVRPPEAIYSEDASLSFESFNGTAIVFSGGDDIEYSAETYIGAEIEDTESHKKMGGITLRALNDYGEVKLAYNRSTVLNPGDITDGKNKTYLTLGLKANWNQWLLITEYVDSEYSDVPANDTYGAFATVGYKIGQTTPHITYQKYDRKTGQNQDSWTLGVRHYLGSAMALKLEVQDIKPEAGGLFVSQPAENNVNIISAAINLIF